MLDFKNKIGIKFYAYFVRKIILFFTLFYYLNYILFFIKNNLNIILVNHAYFSNKGTPKQREVLDFKTPPRT